MEARSSSSVEFNSYASFNETTVDDGILVFGNTYSSGSGLIVLVPDDTNDGTYDRYGRLVNLYIW